VSLFSKINLQSDFVFCKELKVKHLKVIYKCLLGDDSEFLFYNLNIILNDLTSKEIDNINFLDYFILLMNIRCLSIGNIINVQISEDTSLEINFNKIIDYLIKTIEIKNILTPDNIDNIVINYKLPKIFDIIEFNNNPEKIHYYFIDNVQIKNTTINFKDINECEFYLGKLPARCFSLINNKVNTIINYFNEINLLNYNENISKQDISIYFNFNIKNLYALIKILFGNELLSLYENILILCKLGNFTPEYIENCTPGEYLLFMKKMEEISKSNKQQQNQKINNNETEEIAEEASYNPYMNDEDLPPITSEFSG
jgi:hypothetical protein